MSTTKTVSIGLIRKITLTFLLLLVVMAGLYTLLTFYLTRKHFEEVSQNLHRNLAQHLIDEKFQGEPPFLEDGTVNKPLFADLMHDMMAVNRSIEVYLLDKEGAILFSVVLDHEQPQNPIPKVSLAPIKEFIEQKGSGYIVGDDPRNGDAQKIFSAAPYTYQGREGFIYIVLAGQQFELATNNLMGTYFLRLGMLGSLATLLFAAIIAVVSVGFLTRSLREIITTVRRFKEGDMQARVDLQRQSDLPLLGETYNNMADTLVANLDELKSVESLRRELIANVSHDLRTPLAITQGYIETLQIKEEALSAEERAKYLTIIQQSNEKLGRLVNQLFEYSKLEAKQITPQKEPFSVADLAYDVVENYQSLAVKKGVLIELEVEKQLPLVFADISLVDRVIQNLMDNALKYTPAKGTVTIGLTSTNQGVSVSIKDTGIGIPENELKHIFERYKKGSTHRQKDGAGLGLAIATKILEIHDSTLKVISQPNQGTTFTFSLHCPA